MCSYVTRISPVPALYLTTANGRKISSLLLAIKFQHRATLDCTVLDSEIRLVAMNDPNWGTLRSDFELSMAAALIWLWHT